jgi:hypothetical protein
MERPSGAESLLERASTGRERLREPSGLQGEQVPLIDTMTSDARGCSDRMRSRAALGDARGSCADPSPAASLPLSQSTKMVRGGGELGFESGRARAVPERSSSSAHGQVRAIM